MFTILKLPPYQVLAGRQLSMIYHKQILNGKIVGSV